MTKYLNRLKDLLGEKPLPKEPSKPSKLGFEGFEGGHSRHISEIKPPRLDSEGVPCGLCPSCGGGEFWRLPVFHPRHNPRGWWCCSCSPIPKGAGPCDFCGVPDSGQHELRR